MTVHELLQRVLREPTPSDLWGLHPHLLAMPNIEGAQALLRSFYAYLSDVQSKLTSKQYSALSAGLAAGSVGVIATQDIVEAFRENREQALANLLAGGLAATLETFATLQHVKAWETEFSSMHAGALWDLYDTLWQLSVETQPDLPVAQRHALIDELLAPARNPGLDSATRTAVIIRLYQLVFLLRLVPALAVEQDPA